MRKTVRRYKFGLALGLALCFLSLSAVAFVIWRAWPEIADASSPLSAFWEFLWAEDINLTYGAKLKLVSVVVLAGALFLLGMSILAFSRQQFVLPGTTMKLQCPFCSKFWSAGYDRGKVLCPHCRHLVHPSITNP